MDRSKLRIIPFYTGDESLEAALNNPKSLRLLWLEVLFNDEIPWEEYLDRPEVGAAYEKACAWYSQFKTMIEGHAGKRSLPLRKGNVDMREHRTFLEVLNFVSC
ncbi:hypothetical protein [Candidatus Manganitrophus noduliformans]|uniref:Uncharacterized protein n=1 Tax=Candidatus Manganitrophus noduliformans TaxID=2606439 RepID=A0A7X6DQB3_9BACT|nr:hypothetical protein [Candidatus Manganitrophus noduliformans]NKE71405.1 hypothetical protein [Candidatus Manganitrophus noduliformans]